MERLTSHPLLSAYRRGRFDRIEQRFQSTKSPEDLCPFHAPHIKAGKRAKAKAKIIAKQRVYWIEGYEDAVHGRPPRYVGGHSRFEPALSLKMVRSGAPCPAGSSV